MVKDVVEGSFFVPKVKLTLETGQTIPNYPSGNIIAI